MFIAIEGTDAVGKHTQTERLARRLTHDGALVTSFAFPRYTTPLGEAILRHLKQRIAVMQEETVDSSDHKVDGLTYHSRAPEDAMVFQCMMTVDKYDAVPLIKAALEPNPDSQKQKFVITDRWRPSAECYGAADGLSPEWLNNIQKCLPQADFNILLDVDPGIALSRRPNMRDRYEKDRTKIADIRCRYLEMWSTRKQEDKSDRIWAVVDASPSADIVADDVYAVVRPWVRIAKISQD